MFDPDDETPGWIPPLESRFPEGNFEGLDPYNEDSYTPDPYSYY
jgi:hypothetical protein